MSADIYEDPRQPENCPVILQTRRKYEESMRNLAGPNTIMQGGAWPYLLKMLFWELWGKSNIAGPSPVLWLFRVPLVTSCVLPLDCPAHPDTWAYAVRGAATMPRILYWKLHGSIFCQSFIDLQQVDSSVFQLQTYSGTQDCVSVAAANLVFPSIKPWYHLIDACDSICQCILAVRGLVVG